MRGYELHTLLYHTLLLSHHLTRLHPYQLSTNSHLYQLIFSPFTTHGTTMKTFSGFARGDLWLLWRPESEIASVDSIEREAAEISLPSSTASSSTTATTTNTAGMMKSVRTAFVDAKMKYGYPLPWFKGIYLPSPHFLSRIFFYTALPNHPYLLT